LLNPGRSKLRRLGTNSRKLLEQARIIPMNVVASEWNSWIVPPT
jgi:hypothetical protein